jgi:hypothetical protein
MSAPLTWDEVRARSEEKLGGMTVFCWDCDIVFPHSQLPCRKHATEAEREQIDKRMAEELSDHPLIRQINRSVGWDE